MEKKKLHILITKFLNNELDDAGKSTVQEWIEQSEENRLEFEKMHQAFLAGELETIQNKLSVDSAWGKIKSQISTTDIGKIIRLKNIWRVAASIAIFISLGLTAYIVTKQPVTSTTEAIVKFQVPKGEKSQVLLADGTTVWLNSESQLKYDANKNRQVYLEGEAWFDVKHDSKNPFIVSTKSGNKIQVLGTKFNLKAYAGQKSIETTLEEGKVRFLGSDNRIIGELKPGEQITYYTQTRKVQLQEVNIELYSLWKNNILKFDGMLLEDVVEQMEHWYGVKIELDNKLKKSVRFTMTIKTETIRELLNMMQLTADFNYKIEGENVRISSNK